MQDAGVAVRKRRTMDGTRRLGDVSLDSVPVKILQELSAQSIRALYDTALVALSNEMIGGAQELLRSAIEYTRVRFQFGRPIGSFQSLKHRLADLHVDVELAKVAAWQAAAALASGDEPSVHASLAKFTTADTYVKAALEAIQLHGGIGFTWENDTHLWYRRAKSSEVFLGTPAFHRERMLKEMHL
jgi:alkylation response protein AidB-like acyl-CoA dehydrogenase